MEYIRLCRGGVETRGELVATDDNWAATLDYERENFFSIFRYNEEHYRHFREKGSVRGIRDVTTPLLVWDFDSHKSLVDAQTDTRALVAKLIDQGVTPDSIRVAFSGSKGFSVVVDTDKRFTPEQFKNAVVHFAGDLKTFDKSIHDPQRVFRVPCTRHGKSKLYKYPLTLDQLELPIDHITTLAQSINDNPPEEQGPQVPIELDDAYFTTITTPQKAPRVEVVTALDDPDRIDIDWSLKRVRGFPNCKWALSQGYFKEGQRTEAMMILSATLKYLGFPRDHAYSFCKAALRASHARYPGKEKYSKEELWQKNVDQVYSPGWIGGQYSCKSDEILKPLCARLGEHKCSLTEGSFVSVGDMIGDFYTFAAGIEENTIKTGVPLLDNKLRLTIGMPVALLGAPGSAKTSIALDWLKNTSMAGIHSAFFSMDMYKQLLLTRQVSKATGLDTETVWQRVRENDHDIYDALMRVKEEYSRVAICHRSGISVGDMRDWIMAHEDATGNKIKLTVIDYLECIHGPYSDATANTAKIASELKDMAIDMNMCVVVLVQPPKSAGDASKPLTSMRQVKGSSMLEQSFRVILGIYREGFGPQYASEGLDRFLTVACLKNTMGGLFRLDTAWDGIRGQISELGPEGAAELNQLRERRVAEDKARQEDHGW